MGKVKFSHDIEESLRQEFDTIAENLPGLKYEVVEAMILAFKTLPGPFQEKLLSKRPEVRAAAVFASTRIGSVAISARAFIARPPSTLAPAGVGSAAGSTRAPPAARPADA